MLSFLQELQLLQYFLPYFKITQEKWTITYVQSTALCQKALSDFLTFLQERQKDDYKLLSFPLIFAKMIE